MVIFNLSHPNIDYFVLFVLWLITHHFGPIDKLKHHEDLDVVHRREKHEKRESHTPVKHSHHTPDSKHPVGKPKGNLSFLRIDRCCNHDPESARFCITFTQCSILCKHGQLKGRVIGNE